MPRAAIISWDESTGEVILLTGGHPSPTYTRIPYNPSSSQQNGEAFAQLCAYLQRLAPILPPTPKLGWDEAKELPIPTKEDLAKAQKFSYALPAKGSGVKVRPATNEELRQLLDEL